jgi:hypothetical protein
MTDHLGRLLLVTLEAARVNADLPALGALRSWWIRGVASARSSATWRARAMIFNWPGTTRRAGGRPSTRPGWSTRPRALPARRGSRLRGGRSRARRGMRSEGRAQVLNQRPEPKGNSARLLALSALNPRCRSTARGTEESWGNARRRSPSPAGSSQQSRRTRHRCPRWKHRQRPSCNRRWVEHRLRAFLGSECVATLRTSYWFPPSCGRMRKASTDG